MARTFTVEEVQALTAGPELDALVAEHVFGWRWWRALRDFSNVDCGERALLSPDYPPIDCELATGGEPIAWWNVKDNVLHYSDDVETAFGVVEHLRTKFSNVALCGDNGWGFTCWNVDTSGEETCRVGPVSSDTPMLAICRTALLAVNLPASPV